MSYRSKETFKIDDKNNDMVNWFIWRKFGFILLDSSVCGKKRLNTKKQTNEQNVPIKIPSRSHLTTSLFQLTTSVDRRISSRSLDQSSARWFTWKPYIVSLGSRRVRQTVKGSHISSHVKRLKRRLPHE